MESTHCLNCESNLSGKYCSNCGQKADTHRITFKNFIFHDVLHGTFHIEKGILFTAKQALIRPGKAAIDYIEGKRQRYYNVFLLILLTIGSLFFIRHFYEQGLINQGRLSVTDTSHLNQASKTLNAIFEQKGKIIIFLFVPLAAINSFLIFRRKKLNLSEHAIISGMILLGILLITTITNFLFSLNLILHFSHKTLYFLSVSFISLTFIYIVFAYYNAFGKLYSIFNFSYKIILFFTFIFIEIILLLILTIGLVTNWEFGNIVLTPF